MLTGILELFFILILGEITLFSVVRLLLMLKGTTDGIVTERTVGSILPTISISPEPPMGISFVAVVSAAYTAVEKIIDMLNTNVNSIDVFFIDNSSPRLFIVWI